MKQFILYFLLSIATLCISTSVMASYYSKGTGFYIRKNFEKAREMFLKSAETTNNGNAYYFLGEIEKNKHNYDEAERYYNLAVEQRIIKRKYMKNAFWNLLIFAERRQDYSKVVRVCKQMYVRMRDPSGKRKIEYLINKSLWTNNKEAIAFYRKGIRYKKSNTKKAIEQFKKAMNTDYNFLAPRFELGIIAYRKGDYSTAASHLGTVTDKIPFYAEAHLMMGEIHYEQRYFNRAIESFSKVFEYGFVSRRTENIIKEKRGACYYRTGDYERAAEDFQDLLASNKKWLKPYIMLAAISIKQNEYKRALSMLSKANTIKPNNPVILYQIGSIYYKQNKINYLSYFDRVFDIVKNKKNISSKYTRIFTIILKEHYNKKNYSRVREILKAIPDSNYNYEINLIVARTSYNLKNYDKAIDYFEKISLNSEDRFSLSIAYARTGKKQKSIDILRYLITDKIYYQKAKNTSVLNPLVIEIEKQSQLKETTQEKTPDPDKKNNLKDVKKTDPQKISPDNEKVQIKQSQ
jgi:tetratricopeptide (TPR) repeat protein